MKSKTALIGLVLFALILAACARAPAATPAPSANYAPSGGRDIASAPALEPGTASEAYSNKAADSDLVAQQPAAVNRLVIKNADLIIVVTDPAVGMTAILDMANEMGGYVVSSKSFKTRSENGIEVPQANITVRIPSEKLDDALVKVKKLTQDPAKDVRTENITGKDVTADYVDLSSRLTNLQNTEKSLQKIQDSATKTDDVLAVFNRLSEVRQQIEQIKGQMKYYEESAALSSVSVQLLSKEGVAPLTVGGWEPAGIVRDAFQALIDIGKGLVEILIWLVIVFVPLGLIFFFPIRWLIRVIRKNMANKPVPMAATPYYSMPPMDQQPPQSGPYEPPSQST
jgi:hypothetical protein